MANRKYTNIGKPKWIPHILWEIAGGEAYCGKTADEIYAKLQIHNKIFEKSMTDDDLRTISEWAIRRHNEWIEITGAKMRNIFCKVCGTYLGTGETDAEITCDVCTDLREGRGIGRLPENANKVMGVEMKVKVCGMDAPYGHRRILIIVEPIDVKDRQRILNRMRKDEMNGTDAELVI